MRGDALGFGFAGLALCVGVLVAAAEWDQKPRGIAKVEAAALPLRTPKVPPVAFDPQRAFADFYAEQKGLAFDRQQAFADFYAKQQAPERPVRTQSQPGQPWSLNPPPGRLRPIIVDLNARRTEL